MTMISVVVPLYNEEAIVTRNLQIIAREAESENHTLEVIAVNDGSTDGTWAQICSAAASDSRIRGVNFTRNFGKEAAILAGLMEARGDAVIVIDADLQHPPALIPEMIGLWKSGFPVVEAVKASRGREGLASGLFARAFYTLFHRLSELDIAGHSDFKLLDRAVVQTYINLPERNRFFRGLIHWAGFRSAHIPFEVAERDVGGSKWNKLKLLKYAVNNITMFSSFPLKSITWLGALMFILGGIVGAMSLIQKAEGSALDGFTTVNLLIIMTSSILMVSLGIIGHYLSRIYDEIKGRPPFVRVSHEKDVR
ncbi:putative glycosyltransferase [Cupriavidus yeoncheonensis]|uniref:Glycosyltransferase n=1 Tax=Cupriavidus yeoncheonensis TaxID=1462994 RepID=A0A916IPS0_9BURK|nr:glycosyltransferase family 2 protein [Cupriavidus yeoncheonensis]CAG2128505.1 putative glycosyltransferase [Cupriavidus yeoncheonensis]